MAVQLIRSDLEFILEQILIAERHAAGEDLFSLLPNSQVPFGLRTVDGIVQQPGAGPGASSAPPTTLFPRTDRIPMLPRPARGSGRSYAQTSGFVFDSQPRIDLAT